MKKVLSFVLVLAMILGSVSMAFAATALPFEDAPNSKLATVLRDLGVLKGSDGKVFLDTPVSRAEICAILMRVLGYEDYCTAEYAINGASSFSDVAPKTWYNGYVNVAAQLGYVNGVGDGKFNPLGNVGLYDGVAFIMKALGYSADHLLLDWPYNFLVPAQTMGLLKGVDTSSAELTREAMFTILYNALDKPIVKWNKTAEDFVEIPATGLNTFAELASKTSGAAIGDYATDAAFITEATKGVNPALDLSAYVGKYVEVLSKGGIIAVLGETSIASSDIEYDKNNNPTTLGGLKISSAAVLEKYYVNGQEIPVASYNAIANSPAALAKGYEWTVEAKIVKNAAKVDVVDGLYSASVELMNTRAMASKAFAASCAALTKASIANCDVNFSGSAVLTVVRGAASSLDEIKEDDILDLYTLYDGKTLAIIDVTRDVVEGVKLTKVVSGKYTFDNGETYETDDKYGVGTAAGIVSGAGFNFAKAMTLYLNGEGEIFASEIPGEDAPVAPTTATGYAVVATQSATVSYSWDAVNYQRVPATNCAVTIVPFGAPEAVKFEKISVAGLTTANGWETGKALNVGDLVEFKVTLDGELVWITKGGLSTETANGKFKDGKVGSVYLVKDAVLVNKLAPAVATGRGVLEASALEGKVVTAVAIKNAVTHAIETLIVAEVEADAIPSDTIVASPVAVIAADAVDANGQLVVYYDGEQKSAYVSGNAIADFELVKTALYEVTMNKSTGKVTTINAISGAYPVASSVAITSTAVSGSVTAVQINGVTDPIYLVNPTIWVYTADGFAPATEATLEANVKKYAKTTGVDFYKFGALAGSTDSYNFVVIY